MTTNKDTVIACLQQNFSHLREQYHIKKIGLFGSFATETQTETSDVDLVVEFEQPIGLKFVDLCDDLEAYLGRKVDVLTMAGIASIHNRAVADRIMESVIYLGSCHD